MAEGHASGDSLEALPASVAEDTVFEMFRSFQRLFIYLGSGILHFTDILYFVFILFFTCLVNINILFRSIAYGLFASSANDPQTTEASTARSHGPQLDCIR